MASCGVGHHRKFDLQRRTLTPAGEVVIASEETAGIAEDRSDESHRRAQEIGPASLTGVPGEETAQARVIA
jgi:hypothetical protein